MTLSRWYEIVSAPIFLPGIVLIKIPSGRPVDPWCRYPVNRPHLYYGSDNTKDKAMNVQVWVDKIGHLMLKNGAEWTGSPIPIYLYIGGIKPLCVLSALWQT